jgi:hypothetical protein
MVFVEAARPNWDKKKNLTVGRKGTHGRHNGRKGTHGRHNGRKGTQHNDKTRKIKYYRRHCWPPCFSFFQES